MTTHVKVAETPGVDARYARWFEGIPQHLRHKVNGSDHLEPFLNIGNLVTDLLGQELTVLPRARTVLDFGVGLGRVLWPMMQRYPQAGFIGFDVDPMMVFHTKRLGEISGARIVHTTQRIKPGTIDAVYVISVFTHLLATTDYWLGEIHRLLSPHGQAFLTYHDDTLYDELRAKGTLPPDAPDRCPDRLLVGGGSEGSTQLAVFYQTSYWEECLNRFFIVEKTSPRGVHGHQSFSVVRKRDVDVDHASLRYLYMCTLEEELYRLREAAKLMF